MCSTAVTLGGGIMITYGSPEPGACWSGEKRPRSVHQR